MTIALLAAFGFLAGLSAVIALEYRLSPNQGERWRQCGANGPPSTPCVDKAIEDWYKYNYSESKDLAKAFLTLLVGVFVASITFSEKIADFKTAGRSTVVAMLLCWILLLVAISTCGLGLTAISFALYRSLRDRMFYEGLENNAGLLFAFSGAAFLASLIAMFVAGLHTLFGKSSFIPQATMPASGPETNPSTELLSGQE